jgi:hypothetical protein
VVATCRARSASEAGNSIAGKNGCQCVLEEDNSGSAAYTVAGCEMRAYIAGMKARDALQGTALLVLCAPCAFGQLPRRVERCLPYPTYAQEIRDMRRRVLVRVSRVEFDADDGIPANLREKISAELRGRAFEEDGGR